MAVLTWQNVNAPDLSGAAQAIGQNGQNIGGAFNDLAAGLGAFNQARQDRAVQGELIRHLNVVWELLPPLGHCVPGGGSFFASATCANPAPICTHPADMRMACTRPPSSKVTVFLP